MSKSKHTKDIIGVASSFLVVSNAGQIIANCQPIGVEKLDVPFEEAVANAILFAAAPDLLVACEMSLKEFQNILAVAYDSTGRRPKTSIENRLEAAIAKVEKVR